jgi:hypothetical protein
LRGFFGVGARSVPGRLPEEAAWENMAGETRGAPPVNFKRLYLRFNSHSRKLLACTPLCTAFAFTTCS